MRGKGLKVAQVAAALRVHERTVSGWRSGDRGPSPDEAARLADLLVRPDLPSWWTWPPDDVDSLPDLSVQPEAVADPAQPDNSLDGIETDQSSPPASDESTSHTGSDGSCASADESTAPKAVDADAAGEQQRRRSTRTLIRVVVGLVLVVALAVVLVLTTHRSRVADPNAPGPETPTGNTAPPTSSSATSRPSTSPGGLDTGPTVTIAQLSCSRPVEVSQTATVTTETQGGLGATTFTNPPEQCGAGPKLPPGATVQVVCRLLAPEPSSVNPDGYWYLLGAGEMRGRFAAANTFLNGDPPGAGNLTNTDPAVPRCVITT